MMTMIFANSVGSPYSIHLVTNDPRIDLRLRGSIFNIYYYLNHPSSPHTFKKHLWFLEEYFTHLKQGVSRPAIIHTMNLKRIWSGFLIFLGFWLSPLSPWNDLFTNIPIAYVFAFLVSLGFESLFLPAFITGYWLSNILGFILMHYGYVRIRNSSYSFKKHWGLYLLVTTIYTLLIVTLIQFDILPSAEEIAGFIN